jgi:hypothetical protein
VTPPNEHHRLEASAPVRLLIGLVREMAPIVAFFFIALMIILVLLKLLVAEYSIEFYAFGRAALGALIVGKVVLLMDWAVSGHQSPRRYPRALGLTFKTLLYGSVVAFFTVAERLWDDFRKTGSLAGGMDYFLAHANLDRILALVILITLLVGTYLVFEELSQAMGAGALYAFFFARPTSAPDKPIEMSR